MREILKSIYRHNYIEPGNDFDFDEFLYFLDKDYNIFGIKKSAVTANELQLILSQFDLLSEDIGYEENRSLLDYLMGKSQNLHDYSNIKYYFIKFIDVKDAETLQELDVLLKELFMENTHFVKLNNIYILIVTDKNELEVSDSLKSIESDFLIPIICFESDNYPVNEYLPRCFQFDFTSFKRYHKTNKLIIGKTDLLKNCLLSNLDEKVRKEFKTYVLKNYVADAEMMNIINTYFNTNFNLSLAAKQCYMHRNTFINKIDRFISDTNFNLRDYAEAMLVYMALII